MIATEQMEHIRSTGDEGTEPMKRNEEGPTAQRAARDGSATEILLLWAPMIGTARTVRVLEEMRLM